MKISFRNHPLEMIYRRPKHPSSDKSAVATLPIIHIAPVSRGSFTSWQCLCRGPRCRSAVIMRHAVCFLYHAVVTLGDSEFNDGACNIWKQSAATRNQWLLCNATAAGCHLTLNYLGTSSVNPSAASLSSWSDPPAPNFF